MAAYGILKVAKCKGGSALGGFFIHDSRKKGVSHSNPDIDFGRSSDNEWLLKPDRYYSAAVDRRIKQVLGKKYGSLRKDAVKVISFVLDISGEFDGGRSADRDRFLRLGYDWLAERFGRENMIGAVIHRDETNAHLHAYAVPITRDGRLSARDFIGSPKKLQAMQNEFYVNVSERFGLERCKSREEGEPVKRGLPVKEFKRQKDIINIERDREVIDEARKLGSVMTKGLVTNVGLGKVIKSETWEHVQETMLKTAIIAAKKVDSQVEIDNRVDEIKKRVETEANRKVSESENRRVSVETQLAELKKRQEAEKKEREAAEKRAYDEQQRLLRDIRRLKENSADLAKFWDKYKSGIDFIEEKIFLLENKSEMRGFDGLIKQLQEQTAKQLQYSYPR
jgi:hypothetical protein